MDNQVKVSKYRDSNLLHSLHQVQTSKNENLNAIYVEQQHTVWDPAIIVSLLFLVELHLLSLYCR
jgi:hypothetical protein